MRVTLTVSGKQPRQPLAGILSGFVGIQTEEHPLHIWAFREELPQCFARHPAQRQIIVLLPVFREQFDEGQQVDGRFKDQQLLVGATMGKAKRLFCTGCILPERLMDSPATCIAWVSVCIPANEHCIVMGCILIDVTSGNKEVYQ